MSPTRDKLEKDEAEGSLRDALPVGAFRVDRDGACSSVTGRFARLLGLEPEAARGHGWHAAVHSGDLPRVLREWSDAVAAGRSFAVRFRVDRSGAEARHVLLQANPLRDAGGALAGFSGAATDVSDLGGAEEALRETNARLRSLVEWAPEAIVLLDLDGRISEFNPAAERIYGWRREEVLGRHPPPVVREGEEPVEALFDRVRGGEILTLHEVTRLRKDGTEFVANVRIAPLRDARGDFAGAFVMTSDETEGKRSRDQLHELSGRLLELQDAERRRIARELHDSTAQALAAVEMNLTVIESQCRAGADPRLGKALDDTRRLVEECSREVRNLSSLLHPPLLDEVGLVSALRWFADTFADRSGLRVRLDVGEGLPRLPREVETALFRIVQECLTNVHRHAESELAVISIASGEHEAVLEVRDCGRGFRAGVLGEGGHGVGGLGVGIAGMRERVRQLGGRLEVETGSAGTTVRATLPRVPRRP